MVQNTGFMAHFYVASEIDCGYLTQSIRLGESGPTVWVHFHILQLSLPKLRPLNFALFPEARSASNKSDFPLY
jgi:hypothetical protein